MTAGSRDVFETSQSQYNAEEIDRLLGDPRDAVEVKTASTLAPNHWLRETQFS